MALVSVLFVVVALLVVAYGVLQLAVMPTIIRGCTEKLKPKYKDATERCTGVAIIEALKIVVFTAVLAGALFVLSRRFA